MSHQLGRLVDELLKRHFGEFVCNVGKELLAAGSYTLPLLTRAVSLPRDQVIECLRTLIKYDLATYEPSKNETIVEYKLSTDNVLLLMRYPRYLLQMKSKYGNEAEMMVEEILLNGVSSCTGLILNLARKYKDDKEKNITIVSLKDTFICLATAGYIQQAPVPELKEGSDIPIFVPVATIVPDIDARNLLQAFNGGDNIEDNVYWKVNFDRFHQDFRDDIMIKSMSRLIDDNAGELMRQLLVGMYTKSDPWAPTSNAVSALELRDSCRRLAAHKPLLDHYLTQYLKILEENGSGFIRRTDDSGGGQYVVCMQEAATRLVWQLLDHTVTEKLGSKAARVFRLIRTKKYIEEEDIQKQAMLPAKECKRLTYELMQEHFISIRPMRKPASSGAMAKAVYLYYINLHEVCHVALEMCLCALVSVMSRGCAERGARGRLLDKRRRVRTVVHGMRMRGEPQENIDDIEETITPPERLQLQDVEKKLKQLSQAELELDSSLFILEWYFKYKTR